MQGWPKFHTFALIPLLLDPCSKGLAYALAFCKFFSGTRGVEDP
jgi:hypothetical protein